MIELLAAVTFYQGLKHCGQDMFDYIQNGLNFKVSYMKSEETRIGISNRSVIVWALRIKEHLETSEEI